MDKLRLSLVVIAGIAWLTPARAARAQRCRIDSKAAKVGAVQVKAGMETIELELARVGISVAPITAEIGTVYVQDPLRFTVHGFSMKQLPIKSARPLALHGGRLLISPKAPITVSGVRGGFVTIAPALASLTLRAAPRVSCRVLTISDARPAQRTVRPIPLGANARAAVGSGFFALYSTRRRVAPLWVKLDGGMTILEQKSGWLRVERTWEDGSRLGGWVPAGDVQIHQQYNELGLGGIGTIGRGGCGRSHPPAKVKLTVRANARIAASAAGAVWARTARKLSVTAMAYLRADGWIQIAQLDGLPTRPCQDHRHLWVHISDVVWKKAKR